MKTRRSSASAVSQFRLHDSKQTVFWWCVCVFVCVYLSVRHVSGTLVAVHAVLVKVHS